MIYGSNKHLRAGVASNWPSDGPFNILLKKSVLLLNAIPNYKIEKLLGTKTENKL